MKRSTLIKAAGILAAVIALGLIIWFSAFYRADEIRVTDGKLEGVRQTWLVASFPMNGEKAYRKLADVSAPRELSQVKDAPDTDGDPLTTFFVFEGKAGTAYEGYRVTVEGLEGGAQGTPHSAAGAEGLISETDGGIVFDMPSPYSEAVIRLTVTAPEGAAKDTALACLDAAAAKVTPGKKLSALAADFKLNFIDDARWKYLWTGLGVTLEITLFAVLMGIAIGVIVAVIRTTWEQNAETLPRGLKRALLRLANSLCQVYLTVIRGTPVVIQLMIAYYIVFVSTRNGVLVAIFSFGINSGAYVAEIIRGGLMSVDRGQLEAGRSLGFNYVQTMAFIIVPQAFRTVLPALANEFIVLLKETSVSGYVAVRDLTKGGDIIRGVTYSAFMPLLAVAAIYLVLVMFFTRMVSRLEGRLRAGEH